jgi:hypothetical protein
MTHCPKCDADVGDSYQEDDPSVGIVGGYYCDACDIPVDGDCGPQDDDVPIMSAREFRGDRPIGTPISGISGRPGHPGYDEFCRIAKSWGFD